MTSKVYLTSAEVNGKSLLTKLRELVESLPLSDVIDMNKSVVVKVHMGTKGCTRFIRPIFIREIVNTIKNMKTKPFVTDTTTLYSGDRSTSAGYYAVACSHGYVENVLGCPVVIADDSKFKPKTLPTKGGWISEVEVAGAIVEADNLVVVSHVKGHDLAGFGGAIKNLGMGCLTKMGKSQVHSATKPAILKNECVGCGVCIESCPSNAIIIRNDKAFIDQGKCKGCTSCLYSCPQGALYIPLESKIEFQKSLASAASAITEHFKGKIAYVNFIMDVTPICECAPFSNLPIITDVGILASTDIVAIDKVSLDLLNEATIYPGSILDRKDIQIGDSKFQALHGVDPLTQILAAEILGLGSTRSMVINIDED